MFFVGTPSVSLETAGFFHSATPPGCFSLCLERPRKSPKLPAPRADVTAAGRARPRGFVLLSRRGVQNPSILTVFSVFPHLPQASFPAAVLANTSIFRQRSRTAVQRPVFGLPAGTRSAGRQKWHKPPTRARQAVTGVLSALNLCFQQNRHIFVLPHPRPVSASVGHSPAGAPPELAG